MSVVFHSNSLSSLKEIAKEMITFSEQNKIFCFYGEMGVGKTTLIKELIKFLGVEEEGSSPTFSIVNEYVSNEGKSIYHFDFYRINSEEEAFDFGYEEYFYSGNYCFIEWPEKIDNLLPDSFVKINIEKQKEARVITLEKVI
jgi:tRNA threonylcarbamoyladenosine biosynthesis protein TsaE